MVYGFILLTRQCWERVTFIFQIMIHARGLPPAFDLGGIIDDLFKEDSEVKTKHAAGD